MRKIMFLLLLSFFVLPSSVFADNNDGIKKDGKSCQKVTFVVDENLPAPNPTNKMRVRDGKIIADRIATNMQVSRPDEGLVAASFMNDSLSYSSQDALYNVIVKCFAEHRPLVLSPDMVWIVIAQAFSHYVNENAEQLRPLLVSHDGKTTLSVETNKDLLTEDADWEAIMLDFEKQIAENSKKDIAQTISADFTTSGVTERIASHITLMDAMKQYFEYVVHYIACGIPNITLLGTAEDWQKVHDKAMALEAYGMGWWTKELDPILTEFVNAANGNANQSFWQDMVMKNTPDYLRGGGCSNEKSTELDGWVLKLFPYDKDGNRTPEKVAHTRQLMSEMVRVPFRYVKSYPDGHSEETPMELCAGIIGVKEDTLTYALTPQIGWMVRIGEQEDDVLKEWERRNNNEQTSARLDLRVKEVPEGLKRLKVINHLTLTFTRHVNLPQWMDDVEIKHLEISGGDITVDEAEAIRKRFPGVMLRPWLHYVSANDDGGDPPLVVVDGDVVDDVDAKELLCLVEAETVEARMLVEDRLDLNFMRVVGKIDVLKGKDATAVWGIRGANGVIVVTTKNRYDVPYKTEYELTIPNDSNVVLATKVMTDEYIIRMARICEDGIEDVAPDTTQAVGWLRLGAENGLALCQFSLGEYYEKGHGVEQSWEEALKWYRKAAEQGYPYAQIHLGWCYEYGKGVEKSFEEALKWRKMAAEQGDIDAQYLVGWHYRYGKGVAASMTEAAKWFEKSAERGNSDAQLELGLCYEYGRGVAKSMTEAAKWYEQSAKRGNSDAQNNLGLCYEYGRGVTWSMTKAVELYRQSAEQDNFYAQDNLGLCYEYGKGVAKSLPDAVKWYRKSAAKGFSRAQFHLGFCYYSGRGVETSFADAAKWFRKAADQGHAAGQFHLGELYAGGRGVNQSWNEAVKWYKLSAKQGYAKAQCNLGWCYETGKSVAKSREEAIKYYTLAAKQGEERAKSYLERLGVTKY